MNRVLQSISPVFVLLVLLLLSSSCGKDAPTQGWGDHSEATPPADALFKRVTGPESGLTFANQVTEDFEQNVISNPYYYNGGGVGVIDVNKDGKPDLFFSATTGACKLYLNEGNLKFRDITREAGVEAAEGNKTGVSVADVNGDGWQDIYVCKASLKPGDACRNLLFINNKNNTFSELAKAYGLDDPSASNHANFFDYDLDGDLDAYVINFPVDFSFSTQMDLQQTESGQIFRRTAPTTPYDSDRLYRNNGNGTFTDVSKTAGIENRAFGLSCTATDFNQDGRPDLYIANDYLEPDFQYINQGDGTFRDARESAFRHMANHTMGADIADVNGDGLPDLMALDMLAEDVRRQKTLGTTMQYDRYNTLVTYGYGHQVMRNVLQLNNGNGTYSDIGCLAGVFQTDWSWAPLMQDYDLDGFTDLFITNGYRRDVTNLDYAQFTADSVQRNFGGLNPGHFKTVYDYLNLIPNTPLNNYCYRNTGNLRFEDVTTAWGITAKGYSNGSAYADLDADGDLDLIINRVEGEVLLYKNTAADTKKGNWLQIKLQGPAGNPDAFGAVVRVTAGGKVWQQEMTPYRGFFSSSEPLLQFGLGNVAQIDKVEAQFPGGRLLTLNAQAPNQRLTLDVSAAKPGKLLPLPAGGKTLVAEISGKNGLNYQHKDDGFADFNRERLLPWRLSTPGPQIAVGDVNGDGIEDCFFGGAPGTPGGLFVQQKNGQFARLPDPGQADKVCEDGGSVLFDADGDGDKDLFVTSGGSAAPAGRDEYQPRLYLNDGTGKFTRAADALPKITDSGFSVATFDYDSDGDLDLFVGGWCVPGSYPSPPASHILRNDKGKFTDVTQQVAPAFAYCGMVRGIVFGDVNGDQQADMIVSGEWMPITVFRKEGSSFREATAESGLANTAGFWRSLAAADLDGDGDLDLVAGNLGLNTRLKATPQEPLFEYYRDFDANGSTDALMGYTKNGVEYTLAYRDVLLKQLPGLKKKFVRNEPYALATLEDVFSRNDLKSAKYLKAETLSTTWFENQGGKFIAHELPVEAQIAPVWGIVVTDMDSNGAPDLVLAGNEMGMQAETGPVDSGNGLILLNDGKGNFTPVAPRQSGFWATREAHSLALMRQSDGKKLLLVGNQNGIAQVYELINK